MKMTALPSTIGLLLCLHATPALAIPETWVASNGGGAACTRAAPCLTFADAQAATDPKGVIKCVDAADFGPVNITKSITIDCTGTNGGIMITGGNGVTVDAAGIDVTLRGLSIDGAGGSSVGVVLRGNSAVHIEDCHISGFITGFIVVPPSGSVSIRAVLARVQVEKNGTGIQAIGNLSTGSIVVQVRDSVVARNSNNGIAAATGNTLTAFVVDRSSIILNGGDGIIADGAGALVHIGSPTVIGNGGGLIVAGGGHILSYQNNQASGNGGVHNPRISAPRPLLSSAAAA